MIWDRYIPLAVTGSHLDEPAEQGSPTILDFAGMSQPRLVGEFEAIVRECIAGGAQRLLVNFDGANVMDLLKDSQTSIPIGGSPPMPLDTGQPHSTGLLIDAGECWVVDTSGHQAQIDDLLDRFIADTLIDSTVGAKGQGEHHFITPGGAHIPTWYRIGPLLELEGVTELLGFHLARLLQGKSIDLIIPWAEPGIQLAIRLASRLSEHAAEDVGYVPLVKASSKAGGPEISDLDAATVRGKRVLLLTDVLCAGETIRTIADEVDRCGGYTKAIAGILSFDRSKPMRGVLGSIKRQNRSRVAEWSKQPRSGLAGPPYYEGLQWLSQVSDPVYPDAEQCKDCNRGKPYVLLWSGDSHRAVGPTGSNPVGTNSQLARSTLSWSQFWLGAQEARSIGQVEHQVSCSHCHDGQVLDISRLRESTDLWDEITQWAGVEIEKAIRARSPSDTEPIYLVTSPSRGSTILAGELVRQYEQLQGPHIVTRDPHARLWGSRSSTLPAGRTCILIDDSIFNADTVTGMLTYADRRGCQVLGVLSIFYCARGDDHYELVRTLNERQVPLSAAYVAALQWTDKSLCRSHASFELLKRLASWPGWSPQFRQWFETNLNPLQRILASPDSSPKADLQIGRMFRRRQRVWDSHLVRRRSEDDLSMWTQAVAEWDEPDNPFELGPEFAAASTDFGASLDPASAILMLRQLFQDQPSHRMTLAISDLIDGLPLDLCTQQHEGIAELFEQYLRQLTAAGKPPVDKISVALFKVLWDVNLDKEEWLYYVLTACTESEGPLYGSILAAVMASQRTSGEIRTTIRRLQALRDRQPISTADRRGPFVESALRDLDIYRRFRVQEAGGESHEVAVLKSSSDEISVREVDPATEGSQAANTIFIDFNTSLLAVEDQIIPNRRRHGFQTMLSLVALVCLHSAGISTGDLRRFIEPRHSMDDPGGAARQALLTLRKRFGDDGPFLFHKAPGSPWSVALKDGWKWVILDGPSQNNLISLRAFVEGLE